MSFSRWGPDSDVYVYGSGNDAWNDGYTCERCPGKGQQFVCRTAPEMIAHLLEHRARGDKVPEDAIARLKNEPSAG